MELTWAEMIDRVPDDTATQTTIAKSHVWALKAALVGDIGPGGAGVWTVVRSSNGASVANSDLWGATYGTGTQIVSNTAGSPHSWIVLRAPVTMGSLYVCFDCNTTPGSANCITGMKFSQVGFTFTPGTVNDRPTAVDESTGGVNSTAIAEVTTYTQRQNFILSTRGDFLFFCISLSRTYTFVSSMIKMQESRSNDQWPWIGCTTGIGYVGTPHKTFSSLSWYCRLGAGAGSSAGLTGGFLWPYANTTSFLENQPGGGDYQSHLWLAFPAYFGIASTTYGCVKGRLPDIKLGNMTDASVQGAQSPAGGAVEYTLCGGLWLPIITSPTF